MNRIGILLLILCTYLVSPGFSQNLNPTSWHDTWTARRFPRNSGPGQMGRSLRMLTPRLPASATLAAIQTACPPEAQTLGAVCGYVKVPLDREHPGRAKIQIYFELYSHSNPDPAESAILANPGGPGPATTFYRGLALSIFEQNLNVHDLLLIDDRGRGLSTTIECEELQHGTAPFDQAEADCAAQLGAVASRFGTGDIAQDTDAVRAALGYDKVDYFGASYAGEDVTAYATRFGEHLRSIVLHAPMGTPSLEAFAFEMYRTHAVPRMVRLDCVRSPTCSPDHPYPAVELDWLIGSIQAHPLEGDAYDANGNLTHVRIDGDALLFLIADPTGNFTSTGELLAAAESLRRGDTRPLLRLGAEGIIPLVMDYGDPTIASQGALYATQCVDAYEPWDWSDPVSERKKEYTEAILQLPPDYFAPFSRASATSLLFSTMTQCLWWQKPTPSSPVAPPHAMYPHVPTLVLDGDMDTGVPLEQSRKVAEFFPDSTFVPVAGANHGGTVFSQCGANLNSRFIETLQVGDIGCTLTPEIVAPAVGRFPLQAAAASPAEIDPDGKNEIGAHERKVVTVAVATALDALQRTTIGSGNGAGLRAGTFETSFDDNGNQTTTLTNCVFSNDVIVNGSVFWGADRSLVADLNVSGSGTAGGVLHVEGTWQAPGPVGMFKVSGVLGGRNVAVLVPEA